MSKKGRWRKTSPDSTTSPASFPSDSSSTVPETEPELKEGNDQSEVSPTSQSGKGSRPKNVRGRGKSNTPYWRREQLRAAGRARGEQLKLDKEHQSRAGKARAAKGDMSEVAAKGNARAVEKDPEHQSRSRRGKKKSKPGDNDKTIRKGQETHSDQTNEATGEEDQ